MGTLKKISNEIKTIKTGQTGQTGKSNDRSGGNCRCLLRGVGFNRNGVMKTRVCTKCGEEKPETTEYFYRNKASRGGLNTICKVCCRKDMRKWRAENPEKAREAVRRWNAENPEKVRESRKRWKDENHEKAREAVRRWYAENTEKVKEAARRWQAENPEKVREAKKRLSRRCRNTLAPSYLKELISKKYDIHYSEIGDELMEAKRREMKYYRQLKQLKQLK